MCRNLGGATSPAEGKIQDSASEDHWETVALDGEPRQEAHSKSDVTSTTLSMPAATPRDDPRSSRRVADAEKVREDNDAEPERVQTQRNVLGKFSCMKSPPRSQKGALDEQATMKMSHQYYTTGADSNRRKSIPSRVAAKDSETGKADNHRNRKRKETTEAVLQPECKSKTQRAATNDADSVKDLTDGGSSTSLESDSSDAEFKKDTAVCEDGDAEESFRQMILQKYLVKVPGKAMKMQSMARASKDMKQHCRSPATKTWSNSCEHRYFTGKNLHPISPSKSPPRPQIIKGPKKKSSPHNRPAMRQTVSQPAAVLPEDQQAPPKEQTVTGKNSLMLLLRKSWSCGDLNHSKPLGDICTLNGHPLTHREIVDMENSLTEQEKRAIELQIQSAKEQEASMKSQTTKSGQSCFTIEKIKVKRQHEKSPQLTLEEQINNVTYSGICSVELSTVTLADLPLTNASEEGKRDSEFLCDCVPISLLSKAQRSELSNVVEGAEAQQWPGQLPGQGLSALALFPGTADFPDRPVKPTTNDISAIPLVEMATVDGSGGGRIEERQVKYGKGGKQSSNGGSNPRAAGKQAKHGNGAEEARNGFSKQKFRINKVNFCRTICTIRILRLCLRYECTFADANVECFMLRWD